MSRSRWKILPPITQEQLDVVRGEGLQPLIAQLLYNRGITYPEHISSFLAPDARLLNDPFELPDMDKAVARISRALISGEAIAIYGDFDVDGITATTVLTEGIQRLGGLVVPYIPHRTEEGYGLNTPALDRLSRDGISLVITVDCGISSATEVEQANQVGLEVVVTDHHTITQEMPSAVAVVDPKRSDSVYPFSDLAGVGVAFKLLQALLSSLGKDDDMLDLLDLVALGTVADMVSLLGENRYLVKRGLEVLRATRRLGLIELAKCAGMPLACVDADNISWALAPRLNAAGRLDHAGLGYNLLSTDSPTEAQRLANLLDRKNTDRQRITEMIIERAREQIGAAGPVPPLIMVGHEDFHSGVVGVAAGRLAEEFYRPAIVYERGEQWSRGSGRSIPEFNLVEALKRCSDLLYRFGGHPMAAGFTVATDNLSSFQERLVGIAAEQLLAIDLRPTIDIDAEIHLGSFDGDNFKMMQRLAPFGSDNPYPTFLARGVAVTNCRSVGGKGEHLKLKLKDNGVVWDGIAFRQGYLSSQVTSHLDIVFNLEADQWMGGETLQLNILDLAMLA